MTSTGNIATFPSSSSPPSSLLSYDRSPIITTSPLLAVGSTGDEPPPLYTTTPLTHRVSGDLQSFGRSATSPSRMSPVRSGFMESYSHKRQRQPSLGGERQTKTVIGFAPRRESLSGESSDPDSPSASNRSLSNAVASHWKDPYNRSPPRVSASHHLPSSSSPSARGFFSNPSRRDTPELVTSPVSPTSSSQSHSGFGRFNQDFSEDPITPCCDSTDELQIGQFHGADEEQRISALARNIPKSNCDASSAPKMSLLTSSLKSRQTNQVSIDSTSLGAPSIVSIPSSTSGSKPTCIVSLPLTAVAEGNEREWDDLEAEDTPMISSRQLDLPGQSLLLPPGQPCETRSCSAGMSRQSSGNKSILLKEQANAHVVTDKGTRQDNNHPPSYQSSSSASASQSRTRRTCSIKFSSDCLPPSPSCCRTSITTGKLFNQPSSAVAEEICNDIQSPDGETSKMQTEETERREDEADGEVIVGGVRRKGYSREGEDSDDPGEESDDSDDQSWKTDDTSSGYEEDSETGYSDDENVTFEIVTHQSLCKVDRVPSRDFRSSGGQTSTPVRTLAKAGGQALDLASSALNGACWNKSILSSGQQDKRRPVFNLGNSDVGDDSDDPKERHEETVSSNKYAFARPSNYRRRRPDSVASDFIIRDRSLDSPSSYIKLDPRQRICRGRGSVSIVDAAPPERVDKKICSRHSSPPPRSTRSRASSRGHTKSGGDSAPPISQSPSAIRLQKKRCTVYAGPTKIFSQDQPVPQCAAASDSGCCGSDASLSKTISPTRPHLRGWKSDDASFRSTVSRPLTPMISLPASRRPSLSTTSSSVRPTNGSMIAFVRVGSMGISDVAGGNANEIEGGSAVQAIDRTPALAALDVANGDQAADRALHEAMSGYSIRA